MELRQYAAILLKSWWIILPLTLIALTGALVFSYTETPIYRSTSTFVSTLTSVDTIDNSIYGVDTLAGRSAIYATYCQVMTSQSIRNQAFTLNGLDATNPDFLPYSVLCNVLPDANVLMVVVEGPSPALITRLNEAVGMVGMDRANKLYKYFALEKLDPVTLQETPIYPNYKQSGILGAVFGLAIGVSLALIMEYVRSPRERLESLSIRNPKLGVYNELYFQKRLNEEINRARARFRPISVALTRLVPNEDFALYPETTRDNLLRQAALWIQDKLPDGAIIAALGRYTFGILLVETPGDEAKDFLTQLHADLRLQNYQMDEYFSNFVANTGLVESSGGALSAQAMLAKAGEALQSIDQVGESAIQLIRATPRPFTSDESNGYVEMEREQLAASSPFENIELEEL